MTEADHSGQGVQPQAAGGSIGAGSLLKKAREAQGLHIGALAVSLKVPVSKLEALEAGQLEELSGSVFARALASSVCRTLKIDPTPVLAQLPQAVTSQLHQKGDLNEPFRGESRGPSLIGSDRALRPLGLAVAALLLGALLLVFLPNLRQLLPGHGQDAETTATVAAESSVSPTGGNSAAAVEAAAPANVATPVTTTDQRTPAIAPAAPVAPAPVSKASATVPAPSVAGGDELLSFKASGDSWVEVTDAKGVVLLRKMLHAGESVPLLASGPVKVVVGRIDVTEVTVRGQLRDLKAQTKDNVARFEVP